MSVDLMTIKYKNKLKPLETQEAIKYIKDEFERRLSFVLHLRRVSAPVMLYKDSGLNDYLSGNEEPVKIDAKNLGGDIEIVQSLAKWKRFALKKYNFKVGQGLYTDMNAIRKDEEVDFLHSLYVDQWDWERAIKKNERKEKYLKNVVEDIYSVLLSLEINVTKKYGLKKQLPKKISFITTEELEKQYPELSPKERENEITKKKKAVFVMHIGAPLANGEPHDTRAADYDDWKLNGDLLVWSKLLETPIELSSMGIRVDATSIQEQLTQRGKESELETNPYVKAVVNDELPLSIGGGIGQSRLCMFLLQKAHIGEVQASVWKQEDIDLLASNNINLL